MTWHNLWPCIAGGLVAAMKEKNKNWLNTDIRPFFFFFFLTSPLLRKVGVWSLFLWFWLLEQRHLITVLEVSLLRKRKLVVFFFLTPALPHSGPWLLLFLEWMNAVLIIFKFLPHFNNDKRLNFCQLVHLSPCRAKAHLTHHKASDQTSKPSSYVKNSIALQSLSEGSHPE